MPRNGEMPLAVPEAEDVLKVPQSRPPQSSGRRAKTLLLDGLRRRIRSIERHALPMEAGEAQRLHPPWTLGTPEIDAVLGPAGLSLSGVHEIKPQVSGAIAGDWMAALGFAHRLMVRRLITTRQDVGGGSLRNSSPLVLWCSPATFLAELGWPYGPGLSALGLDPRHLIMAETARAGDALWAIEEGLKSQSLAIVLAVLDEVDLTPARRLSLAAAEYQTPCLLITHPRSAATAATATRWRVSRQRSASHPFDADAPGAARYGAALERCRHRHAVPPSSPHLLEWSDAAYRFRMVAKLADRPRAKSAAGLGSG